jgi:hypothetical protein
VIGVLIAVAGGPFLVALLFILGFPILMIITSVKHRRRVAERKRKLDPKTINEAIVGSWF